jgi:hypothetical protein
MIQAQPKSRKGPRVLRCANGRLLAGASDDSLSPDQRTEAARISVGSDWRFNREEIERWMLHEQKRS